jgi:ribosomal protein S18 acetylase RimI-like enzyme
MSELGSLIERNVAEFLLAMGRAGGGEQRLDREVGWTIGGSPIGYHNAVVRCAADDHTAPALVDEWLAHLRRRRLPGSWHLAPSMRPEGLGEILLAAGFADGGGEPAMAVDLRLADLGQDPSLSGDLVIEVVGDEGGLDAYRRVLGDGFGEGPKEADWVASAYATIGLGPETGWCHLVGSVDGQAAATASVFLTGDTAGIYFVSTRPRFRRRGFGAAVTRRAMAEAARLGASRAVLGSSPMGQRVYERLGFRTVFTYRLFEWEP